MLPPKAPALLLLGWVAMWLPNTWTRAIRRELRVSGTGGQPSFSLRISAEGQKGVVAVRDEKGTEVQRLLCPPLQGTAEASEEELAAVREQFVTHFMTDLDFDGHLDPAGIREFGAKWARYCVWLYDRRITQFEGGQMAQLCDFEGCGAKGAVPQSDKRWGTGQGRRGPADRCYAANHRRRPVRRTERFFFGSPIREQLISGNAEPRGLYASLPFHRGRRGRGGGANPP